MYIDNRDKLDRLEDAISCLRDAIDAIKPIHDLDNELYTIEDIMKVLKVEASVVHAKVEEEDEQEDEALMREYYRSVM